MRFCRFPGDESVPCVWITLPNLLQGHIDQSRLLDYSRSSNFWQILIKKDVYADPEVIFVFVGKTRNIELH